MTGSHRVYDIYRTNLGRLYFHGRLWYKDPEKTDHWTDICMYHINGEALDRWHGCLRGNDVDHEGEKKLNYR
jgi:hypothetical protein